MRSPLLKRTFDIAVAVPVLLLSLPLQAVVAVLVWRRLGAPVLFRQQRTGLHGRPFTLVKFRTMRAIAPERGLVADAERTVPLGRALRATSLDELPTLWNVIRGDMSLVGPRPLLPEYMNVYAAQHQRRHDVQPGMTGLAQVSGRNSIPWLNKLDLDVEYVETRTMYLDIKILWRTVRTVLGRSGIDYDVATTYPTLGPNYALKNNEVEDP